MNPFRKIGMATFIVSLSCLVTQVASANKDAVKQTNALMKAFKKVQVAEDDKTLTSAQRKSNDALFKTIDRYFDFEALTGDPIKPSLSKFTKDEAKTFKMNFRQAVRLTAYPNSGAFLEKAETEVSVLSGQKDRDGKPTIATKLTAFIEEDDIESDIVFHWRKQKGQLQVYDVMFDGASLVRDYQNQFKRIIEKSGVAALMKKIETKLKQREESYGKSS